VIDGPPPAPVGIEILPCGTLIERALARLARGPASTETLARDVLALRGNPTVAAAAVRTLLGGDHRLAVDPDGTWSLAVPERGATRRLSEQEWVVVDVETTGGSPGHGDRIIEIGAVRVVGGRLADRYVTLVNPRRPLPPPITSLTGILERDVARAPTFEQIVPELTEVLSGRVFVGHNASFDWRFLCAEMERSSGQTLVGRRLCTLRLARRLLSHVPSRALGALAHHCGIDMEVHHRALDDAVATARLLVRFLDDLYEREVDDWDALQAFFRVRPAKRRRTAMPQPMDAA
jgi:DNA polymerase III epsilon subunit family exonuclease